MTKKSQAFDSEEFENQNRPWLSLVNGKLEQTSFRCGFSSDYWTATGYITCRYGCNKFVPSGRLNRNAGLCIECTNRLVEKFEVAFEDASMVLVILDFIRRGLIAPFLRAPELNPQRLRVIEVLMANGVKRMRHEVRNYSPSVDHKRSAASDEGWD